MAWRPKSRRGRDVDALVKAKFLETYREQRRRLFASWCSNAERLVSSMPPPARFIDVDSLETKAFAEGDFARVHKGKYKKEDIVQKVFKEGATLEGIAQEAALHDLFSVADTALDFGSVRFPLVHSPILIGFRIHLRLPSIIMQYVDGDTLESLKEADRKSIDAQVRTDWIRALALFQLVSVVFSRCHNDISSRNVLVSKDWRVLWVIDFGVTRTVERQEAGLHLDLPRERLHTTDEDSKQELVTDVSHIDADAIAKVELSLQPSSIEQARARGSDLAHALLSLFYCAFPDFDVEQDRPLAKEIHTQLKQGSLELLSGMELVEEFDSNSRPGKLRTLTIVAGGDMKPSAMNAVFFGVPSPVRGSGGLVTMDPLNQAKASPHLCRSHDAWRKKLSEFIEKGDAQGASECVKQEVRLEESKPDDRHNMTSRYDWPPKLLVYWGLRAAVTQLASYLDEGGESMDSILSYTLAWMRPHVASLMLPCQKLMLRLIRVKVMSIQRKDCGIEKALASRFVPHEKADSLARKLTAEASAQEWLSCLKMWENEENMHVASEIWTTWNCFACDGVNGLAEEICRRCGNGI